MTASEPKKIAYLLGAGATNAELSNAGVDFTESGLLMGDVTRRVTIKAKEDSAFLEKNRIFLERAADSANIELFISLIENNGDEIENALEVVDRLKQLVEADIKSVLTNERLEAFYLHKALLELHKLNSDEIVLGLISLNYDTIPFSTRSTSPFSGRQTTHFLFPKRRPRIRPFLNCTAPSAGTRSNLTEEKEKFP